MYNPLTGLYDNRIEKRELKDIDLQEISLVSAGANRKKFLFFKSDDGDELDMLLSVLDSADFDSDGDAAITKSLTVLDSLEQGERSAVAETILAVCKLAGVDVEGDETPMQKGSLRWPSFRPQRNIAKAEPTGEELWPSLCG